MDLNVTGKLMLISYHDLYWNNLWSEHANCVRIHLKLFIRALSKLVDKEYVCDPQEFACVFPEVVTNLLQHALTHMRYLATHFFAKYILFHDLPRNFFEKDWKLNAHNFEWRVPFCALPRFIFFELCKKLEFEMYPLLWQNKQQLLGEYLSIFYLFCTVWNDYTAKPITTYKCVTRRFIIETEEEQMQALLNNIFNTNDRLIGNANTNEIFHGFMNKTHLHNSLSDLKLKNTSTGLITKKFNDIKAFNEQNPSISILLRRHCQYNKLEHSFNTTSEDPTIKQLADDR